MLDINKILVEVSNRHVHLSRKDLNKLFGDEYNLTIRKNLSQPGQYAAEETIDLKYNDKILTKVRILGPVREKTQVEISFTESRYLNINAPYRLSGEIEDSPGIILIGPKNSLKIEEGVIIAKPHLHINYEDAKNIGLKNKQVIEFNIPGFRPRTFHDVVVRIDSKDKAKLSVHIDSDEGNSASILNYSYGRILL
jgi:putative phosphotransacetylase